MKEERVSLHGGVTEFQASREGFQKIKFLRKFCTPQGDKKKKKKH